MKELDMLLLSYVDNHYSNVGQIGQSTFRKLLSMPDPDILALLTGKATTEDEHLADVIKRLLTRD
jgi:antitoxin CptB